jgi:hypothetical protein
MGKLSRFLGLLACAFLVRAQDPTGTLEGQITDTSGGAVADATVAATNLQTGFTQSQRTPSSGFFRLSALPVGSYTLTVDARQFSKYRQQPIRIVVSQTVRVNVELQLATVAESVNVEADAGLVDTATNTLGKVVGTREVLDLPLNGRNFTQLGLLQAGVAPITMGLATAGGSLRSGYSYAVNGQRPESNNYLVDGAKNVNRMDSGFALRVPVDAISEFRILTHTAPPEYGGASGSTTSVVTKSGTNALHGSVYEFLRNDNLDARNFFSRQVEPLKQNQFGVTVGGPIQQDKLFLFGYYEGFRNRQGVTRSATVPTLAQRNGDFSQMQPPLLNFAAGGQPFPNGQIPPTQFDPVALRVIDLYPLGNTSPSVYTSTLVTHNDSNQAGGRADYNLSTRDQFSLRYSFSEGANLNPISIRGSDVPGFPVQDDLRTHSANISYMRLMSPSTVHSARAAFFRHIFDFDQRLNKTPPSAFGFQYESASELGQGPPFFNVNGYSPIGGAITGPRTSTQNTYELYDSLSHTSGQHSWKFGGEFRRMQINAYQAIAPNAFYVFAPSFPTNDAFANLLLGRPVVFYQGLGDLSRGLRNWDLALYLQDEWRVSRKLTLNYGLRHETITPFADIRDRMNAFVPGQQSTVRPDAPRGLLFPGDEGIGRGIAPVFGKAFMPRFGFAWDPTGRGVLSIRGSYAIFFDPFANGSGLAFQAPVSSLPWTQFNQYSGPPLNFSNPYAGRPRPQPDTFVRPSTVVALDHNARPPYAQDWNLSMQRELFRQYMVEVRYVGTKGTRLPRNIEANPAVFGPGATAQNADARRVYANCRPDGTCDFTHVALLSYITNSTYHSGQVTLSRRYSSGFSFSGSYWFAKSLDYLSSINMGGAAARPLSGENDMAQNPFDLRAEHGPSLFDARHRFVVSSAWELPSARANNAFARALLHGWQVNGIASVSSGTPFTVYDSTNVSLQGSHPPVSGFFASRPDVAANPNEGSHTVESWVSRSAFRRLNPQTEAGRFGNAGRNIVRGPGLANVDASIFKNFQVTEGTRVQFRAECFNIANHANFGIPVTDLASANFGRILDAGAPRLLQFGVKILF